MRLVFLHGYTGLTNDFHNLPNYFAKKGYNIHVPTLPGHTLPIEQLAKIQVEQYVTWVQKEIRPEDVVIGYSFGAQLAMASRAKAVVAIAISYRLRDRYNIPIPRFLSTLSVAKHEEPRLRYDSVPLQSLRVVRQVNKYMKKKPVLTIGMKGDHVLHKQNEMLFSKKFGGDVVMLPNTSKHNPMVNMSSDIKQRIASFISRHQKINKKHK